MRDLTCPGVVALVDDPESALAWWRVTAPFTRLRQHHISAAWGKLSEPSVRFERGAVAVFPRLFPLDTPSGRAQMLATFDAFRPATSALIYDVDDDLFSDAYIRHHLLTDWGDGKDEAAMRRQCDAMLWAVGQCDAITAASQPLADLLSGLVDRPIYTVENAIDVRWYRSRLAARSLWHGRLTIGWAGGRRPEADFAAMAEAWGRVARRRPDVLFVVAGDASARRYAAKHVPSDQVQHIEWAHVQDMPMAMQTDIGCCVVEGTSFDVCKTPIKAWEYGLAGASVVATPALYSQDVADGFTGRLATTADEWEAALLELLDDEEQRRYLAANMATRVEQRHGLDEQLWRWPAAWRAIVEGKQAGSEAAA